MKVLTDDPDWAPKIYEARALAMRLIEKHAHAGNSGCLQAACNGLIIKYYPRRSPRLLTVNAPSRSGERCSRVPTLEWKNGDAWRVAVITYRSGRWESRLRAIVHPRPWLERWRAVASFTGSLPREQIGIS